MVGDAQTVKRGRGRPAKERSTTDTDARDLPSAGAFVGIEVSEDITISMNCGDRAADCVRYISWLQYGTLP